MLLNPSASVRCHAAVFFLAITSVVFVGGNLHAQQFPEDGFGSLPGLGGFDDGLGNGGLNEDNPIALSASYELASGSRNGRVKISAELIPDWHIYSVTQAKGGPTRTDITISGPEGVTLSGDFVPDQGPHISTDDAFPGIKVEAHDGIVHWVAPFSIAEGVSLKGLTINVLVKGLTCRTGGACIPLKDKLEAKLVGTYDEPKPELAKPVTEFRNKGSVVMWRSEISPATVAPGETAELRLTAIPDAGYHVYQASTTDSSNSTNFVITQFSGTTPQPPRTRAEIITKEGIGGLDTVHYHGGEVTWTIPIVIPASAPLGSIEIAGLVGYQACNETSCRQPKGVRFTGLLTVGKESVAGITPVSLVAAKYSEVLTAVSESKWLSAADAVEKEASVDPVESTDTAAVANFQEPLTIQKPAPQRPFAVILGMALIGGMILNLMPCVLPVVGLKLMALVETAGEDHRKVLSHNLWYSFGILSVFWVLAAVAIGFRIYFERSFSWGQQFTYLEFKLPLILLVFVMALSFLGVWEIPLPGFASGKASQQLQKKEGATGSFFKGMFTTLLATPCSGPLLGVVFGATLTLPPVGIFVVFTTVGLGMAMPYILIGLVPKLVFWLPKPGAWMETLKQLMAFVLLGTVAFLFAGFSEQHKVPVFVTLIAAWFACWMIGRVPLWDTLRRRGTAWIGGIAIASAIGIAAFQMQGTKQDNFAWEPYSAARLAELQAQGRTVMLDFTASWCVNCHVNYKFALNTALTAEKIQELGAVAMIADWSDENDEIGEKLNELQSNSIPVLAIYPGKSPGSPIILRDIVSQGQVLEALDQAGASVTDSVASYIPGH